MDMEASSMNQRRQKHKVCLVGSGNWGSVIARIAGENVLRHDTIFDAQVNMWVHEELVDGRKLTEIINETHENIKYLPGHVLPSNVVAIPELDEAAKGASVFIFCIPHQFLPPILSQLKSCAPFASSVSSGTDAPVQTSDLMCVSLMKAIEFNTQGVVLLSSKIQQELFSSPLTSGSCSVLMGANVASDVAAGHFCESTLGCHNVNHGHVLKQLFHTPVFRISVVMDVHGVEVLGALKNVVALASGFSDGLGYGSNTKAALIRIGLVEMKKFCVRFVEGVQEDTMFESCGIADLITTAFSGRNRKCAEAFVRRKKAAPDAVHSSTQELWHEIERELLGGQKLQGTGTCGEVYRLIQQTQAEAEFPLFVMIYRIAFENVDPAQITHYLD